MRRTHIVPALFVVAATAFATPAALACGPYGAAELFEILDEDPVFADAARAELVRVDRLDNLDVFLMYYSWDLSEIQRKQTDGEAITLTDQRVIEGLEALLGLKVTGQPEGLADKVERAERTLRIRRVARQAGAEAAFLAASTNGAPGRDG